MRRSRFALAFVAVTVTGIASIVACSSNDAKPPPGGFDKDGSINDKPVNSADAAADGNATDAGGDGDATTPEGDAGNETCTDGFLNGNETDTDCGGALCGKCLDGKTCVRNDDCFGGSCDNTVCKTPNCTDGTTNGAETDVDCGGSTCAQCTIGKKCKAASDCRSGICTNETCECPSGMAKATTQAGTGTYCFDSAEITKGQYQKFLDATSGTVVKQGALCTNNTFQPRAAWGPATAPPYLPDNGLAFNMSLPVHYVDWCDAAAYCKWAGKQLCGKLGGGSLTADEGNDFMKSAWYNACTNEGNYAYPYGNTYYDRCNGTGEGVLGPIKNGVGGFGYEVNGDDGLMVVVDGDDSGNFTKYVHAECFGSQKGAFQLSGNVAEWEDACEDPTSPTSACRVRGGSHLANGDPAKLACNADRRVPRVPANDAAGNASLEDVGIRCCLY